MRIHSLLVCAVILVVVAGGIEDPRAKAWGDVPMCTADRDPLSSGLMSVPGEPLQPVCTPGGAPTGDLDAAELRGAARAAYTRMRELSDRGRHAEALLQLRVVEEAFPRLHDHVNLWRGDLYFNAGELTQACRAYERAVDSIEGTVIIRAKVGYVRCRIRAGAWQAADALSGLKRRYPALPEGTELTYELGRMYERQERFQDAVDVYRRIDMRQPGTHYAQLATERIDAFKAQGIRVRGLTLLQRTDRLERLALHGPADMAKEELASLEGQRLSPTLLGRVALVGARMARIEGNYAEARRYIQLARSAPAPDEETAERIANRAASLDAAVFARQTERAERRIRGLRNGKIWRIVPPLRLVKIVELGARTGLIEPLNSALEALALPNTHARHKALAAVLAAGTGDDAKVARLFEQLLDNTRHGLKARYHLARTYERMGRIADARQKFEEVIASDESATKFYANWSRLRLEILPAAPAAPAAPEVSPATEVVPDAGAEGSTGAQAVAQAEPATPVPAQPATMEAFRQLERPSTPAPDLSSDKLLELAGRLRPIADEYGEVFPWFGRAHDLLLLDEPKLAATELYEGFLSWRDSSGRRIRRVGFESVCRHAERPRRLIPVAKRRARAALSAEAKAQLSAIGLEMGHWGIYVGFDSSKISERPRAYAHIVDETARRYGLDPNLLHAIMRVESVYQQNIVSYAGAVGLMQIMPRTGASIARSKGRESFSTTELLDPVTNIDFAGWYLKSLIERFNGRLPLAIASYNGGPHNVRRWMLTHSESMELDAFLEQIPFTQTHRYVRRVLGHYQAYRAQEDLGMQRLSVELPDLGDRDAVGF